MTKVVLGNHTAVFAARADQDRIRQFYVDILGCEVAVTSDQVDRFRLANIHFIFVWQDAALDAEDFLKAIYLELATDSIADMKKKILAFGVRTIDFPDPHLYFQAPGGQVFKLVGITEDLSLYETSTSSTPAATAAAA